MKFCKLIYDFFRNVNFGKVFKYNNSKRKFDCQYCKIFIINEHSIYGVFNNNYVRNSLTTAPQANVFNSRKLYAPICITTSEITEAYVKYAILLRQGTCPMLLLRDLH